MLEEEDVLLLKEERPYQRFLSTFEGEGGVAVFQEREQAWNEIVALEEGPPPPSTLKTLALSIIRKREEGQEALLKEDLLYFLGKDMPLSFPSDVDQEPFLVLAIQRRSLSLIRWLVERGSDVYAILDQPWKAALSLPKDDFSLTILLYLQEAAEPMEVTTDTYRLLLHDLAKFTRNLLTGNLEYVALGKSLTEVSPVFRRIVQERLQMVPCFILMERTPLNKVAALSFLADLLSYRSSPSWPYNPLSWEAERLRRDDSVILSEAFAYLRGVCPPTWEGLLTLAHYNADEAIQKDVQGEIVPIAGSSAVTLALAFTDDKDHTSLLLWLLTERKVYPGNLDRSAVCSLAVKGRSYLLLLLAEHGASLRSLTSSVLQELYISDFAEEEESFVTFLHWVEIHKTLPYTAPEGKRMKP